MMGINVIILNWNAAADTIRCVRQFTDWQQVQPCLWVVDNGSANQEAEQIAQACPQVHVIHNAANLGFAGGTNRGVAAALAVSDDPILFLNNDASIEEADLRHLMQALAANPTIGIIGPLLYRGGQKDTLITAGSHSPVWWIQNQNKIIPSGPAVFTVNYISGSVALFRSTLFRQLGLLDEGYFFNMEVADFCQRARAAGYQTAVDTQARAKHDVDRSARFRNTLYVYYVIRNRFRYMRKFYPGWRLGLLCFWTLYGLLLALKLRIKGQSAPARAVWLGTVDGLSGRFGGQNDRVLS
jgi:GT2 family glycosyltransferase